MVTMCKKTINPVIEGSISWGTLRTEDLIKAFSEELERLVPFNSVKLRAEAKELFEVPEDQRDAAWQERATEVRVGMQEYLEDLAPEGMYFGAIEGDGADIGFWRVENPEMDAEPDCEAEDDAALSMSL